MSQGKQIKKCRQSFNVYIPPPARKAEKLSQEVIKTEESKNQKVTKTRSGEEQIVNKKTLSSTGVETSGSQNKNSSPFKESVQQNKVEARSDCSKKVSVTLNLTKLSLVCDDDQKFKKKNCLSKVTNDSALSIVEAPKDSDSLCTCSNKLIARKNTKDINVKQETVNADLHKSICDTSQETDGKALSLNEQPNDTLNHEEENRIFSNLWVKLCDNDNLVTKTTKAHNTYRGNDIYGDREINENCILEIYDFPAEFKTSDLREIFSTYITRGMRIRWVDDTHALGIYPSEIIAYEVLNTDLPFLKTRNLNEGIPQSRDKAKLLLPPPPPPRPKTCSASARRMVSGALGIKAVFTQAEIEEEKQLLKVAREQRVAAKQRGLKGS